METHETFLNMAVDLALQNKVDGGRPFGAIITKDNEIIASGTNNMLTKIDPSSHAEMEAMKLASKNLKTLDLKDCVIYASGHPCPMCLAAILMTNIKEVYYAFNNDDAKPFGLSSDHIYEKLKIKEIDAIKITKLKIDFLASDLYS
ncbi:guanine deaminase family protein [Bacteriovorax sp. BSW11_IV]|uniref:nucleoside deaminase n=1 Tax=Bacteriovorax sp. BSW11_IV TaxID=1353529 RepID=UPI00038A494E|nr:nucleoside deaminase [Bacteriovorax sp. BSW11_IV]EQC45937.1 guanine deaminase family protein [Bacteriovorax sp. BSW11_IV]